MDIRSSKPFTFALVGMVVGVLLLAIAVALTSLRQPQRAVTAPPVTEATAKANAQRFSGGTAQSLEIDPSDDLKSWGRDCYNFIDKKTKAVYHVDKSTGRVIGGFFPNVSKKGKAITESQAISRANAFAAKNGLKVPRATATVMSIGGSESDMSMYVVNWQEVKDGVRLPRVLQVSIDPGSGDVVSFTVSEADSLPNLAAAISQDEALALARAKVDFVPTETEAQLEVWPIDGVMTLRWQIGLYGLTPIGEPNGASMTRSASVMIDAQIGDVMSVSVR